MTHRIRTALRAAMLSGLLLLLWAGPTLAFSSGSSVEGAERALAESGSSVEDAERTLGENGAGPVVPEPGAALLFALGAGAVAWGARRRRAAS